MGSLTNLMTESLALYDRAAIDMPNRKIVPFRSQTSNGISVSCELNVCNPMLYLISSLFLLDTARGI